VHKPKIEKFAGALARIDPKYPRPLAGDLDCLLFDMELLKKQIVAFRDAGAASSTKVQSDRLFGIQIAVEQDLKACLRDVAAGIRKVLGPLP
jgi:hypothetical protein